MLVRTLTWAQTAALNPTKPLCISCGSVLPSVHGGLGARLCRECRASSNLLVLPVHDHNLRDAA